MQFKNKSSIFLGRTASRNKTRDHFIFSKEKKERQASELVLVATIEKLEIELAAEQNDVNFEAINANLQAKKAELDNIYAFQAQGAFVRARAQYKSEGEKPTRLFCSLEKHNAVQKHIPKLIVEKNEIKEEITEQKGIENELFKYYKDLFAQKPTEDKDINDFLSPAAAASCPKLSDSQKQKMEKKLHPRSF